MENMKSCEIKVGEKYGPLTILRIGFSARGAAVFSSLCECGNVKEFLLCKWRFNKVRACTCYRKKTEIHGMSRTPVYGAWDAMVKRCTRKWHAAYLLYGGRGVSVCERWKSFENFYADMGDPPTVGHSIDRINNDGNYEPSNCRWATLLEQANNKSTNVRVSYKGKSYTLSQLAKEFNVSYSAILGRYSKGWDIETCVSYQRKGRARSAFTPRKSRAKGSKDGV
jgi:hypothetical protein